MSAALDLARLRPGLADLSRDSQRIFRRIMEATARPGLIQSLAFAPESPAGLGRAAGALLLTLVDADTPLWLQEHVAGSEAETWLRFHCGCEITRDEAAAAFALVVAPAAMLRLSAYNQGDAKYPDRAATIVIEVDALTSGPAIVLRGPGIQGEIAISPRGLDDNFWAQRTELVSRFQFGVDLVLCAGDDLLAIPRTTRTTLREA